MLYRSIFRRLIYVSALLLILSGKTYAQDKSTDLLAKELVSLRGEVEELNAELDRRKARHSAEMRSLQGQRAELQAQIRRESLKMEKLERSLAKQREIARDAGIDLQELKPVVLRALDDLKVLIDDSLPFKRQERLAEVEELRRQVKTNVLTPHKAVNRLWGLYEDEIRLTSENGLYRQAIDLDGEERLVDVARLGMVMMYFRTSNDEYGRVVNDGGQWDYEMLQDDAARDRLENLFDSFNKQIRTGYFVLPNALAVTRPHTEQR